MQFYGISQDFEYKEYISLEKAKESESNILIVKQDWDNYKKIHNYTFYNENDKFSDSFYNKGWKGFISNIEQIDEYKKKFTFTYVSKEGIVKRFYSDYYTQGDLKIISEMFKKFLEISNGCENWDVFDLKIENQNLKQENEWLKHQVDRLKKKEE
tara:strand:+ start:615 stop:1079 length:465 start_codon:yes stop_codon:yes gene_type:complete